MFRGLRVATSTIRKLSCHILLVCSRRSPCGHKAASFPARPNAGAGIRRYVGYEAPDAAVDVGRAGLRTVGGTDGDAGLAQLQLSGEQHHSSGGGQADRHAAGLDQQPGDDGDGNFLAAGLAHRHAEFGPFSAGAHGYRESDQPDTRQLYGNDRDQYHAGGEQSGGGGRDAGHFKPAIHFDGDLAFRQLQPAGNRIVFPHPDFHATRRARRRLRRRRRNSTWRPTATLSPSM